MDYATVLISFCFFFFSSRRRHTRFDCDWSSDVCSSDLEHLDPYYSRTLEITEEHYGCLRDFAEEPAEFEFDVDRPATINRCSDFVWAALHYAGLHPLPAPLDGGSNLGEFAVLFNQIGRASCRERV